MLFSSIPFLFFFLTAIIALYYAVPFKLKNTVLLLFSLFFYAWGGVKYAGLMIIAILLGYVFGLLIEKFREKKIAKLFVGLAVACIISFMLYFKYMDFFIDNFNKLLGTEIPLLKIVLPIGISFYTFQIISYVVDVYRGEKAQKNPINLAAYVAMFPQLIAGPIIKYKDLDEQLDSRTHSLDRFASGVERFLVGLAKKLLLANNLGQLWDVFKAMPGERLTLLGAWLGVTAFAFQIYFDFSGYSDMAIGLGRMFGFEFMENFNYPYISKNITEFWRRWHISLSTWFREYLYIPLGGNRCSKGRWLLNLLIVWAATGIWHGASWNYLLWGLYFFCLLILEKLLVGKWLKKLPGPVQHLYVIFLVLVSWAIFALEDLGQLGAYLTAMAGLSGAPMVSSETIYHFKNFLPVFLCAAVGSTPLPAKLWRRVKSSAAQVILLILGLIICTAYVVASTYNPFLYFRF